MDQANRSGGPLPPPYNPSGYAQHPASGMEYAGKDNIAMVSPPAGPYDNMAYQEDQPEQGHNQEAPPEYSIGFQDTNCFDDAAIKRGFIRKVYLTLMIQLVATVGIICAFLYWKALKEWTISSRWFSFTMMGVVFALIIVLSCMDNIRRKVPLNFIFLGLFTIAEGLLLGSVAVFFNAEAVLWAVGATALVSFAMSAFAMQTKWDFTAAYGCMWALGWTLISFGLLCAIIRTQYVYIVYASLGTLVFSIYLVMDTQLILGGKHKYSISPEEYIFAALNLYLDIISLFLMLLQLIGLCR